MTGHSGEDSLHSLGACTCAVVSCDCWKERVQGSSLVVGCSSQCITGASCPCGPFPLLSLFFCRGRLCWATSVLQSALSTGTCQRAWGSIGTIKPTSLQDSTNVTCKVIACFRGVIPSFIAQSSLSTCSVLGPGWVLQGD